MFDGMFAFSAQRHRCPVVCQQRLVPARDTGLAALLDELTAEEATLILCVGLAAYNALA